LLLLYKTISSGSELNSKPVFYAPAIILFKS
jgi:hypothetical protein